MVQVVYGQVGEVGEQAGGHIGEAGEGDDQEA
jgi:hypothetical protein